MRTVQKFDIRADCFPTETACNPQFKLKVTNINLINDSRYYFNFELPSELLMKRKHKFIEKFMASQMLLVLDYFAIEMIQ